MFKTLLNLRVTPRRCFPSPRKFAAAKAVGAGLVCLTLLSPLAWAQEKVTLRVASFMPPQGFLNTAIVIPYLDRVVADSKGTLEYKFFPAGTLGRDPAQQLNLVQQGTADIAIVLPSFTPGAFESYDVTQLPGLVPTTRAASVGAWRALEGGLLPPPDKVKVLGVVTTASNVLHMRESSPTIASLAGKKIRAAGSLQMSVMNKLGAAAVGNIRGGEIAESLSRNLLDGTLMDWIGIKEFRVDRLTNYHMDVDFGRVAIILPINAEKFASLPEAAKASLLKHGGLAYANAGGKAFDDAVDDYRSGYLKEGTHKAGQFPIADQAKIKAAFDSVKIEWVKAQPGRDAVVDVYLRGAAEVK